MDGPHILNAGSVSDRAVNFKNNLVPVLVLDLPHLHFLLEVFKFNFVCSIRVDIPKVAHEGASVHIEVGGLSVVVVLH